MATKLLVRTPRTRDGVTLVYDNKKQPVYSEAIVELHARKELESLNASTPEHLRSEFSEIEVEDGKPAKGRTSKPAPTSQPVAAAKPAAAPEDEDEDLIGEPVETPKTTRRGR